MIDVGNNIRDQRLAAKLNSKQLADRMGVAQARVVEWEKGYRDPTADTLIRIVTPSVSSRANYSNKKALPPVKARGLCRFL